MYSKEKLEIGIIRRVRTKSECQRKQDENNLSDDMKENKQVFTIPLLSTANESRFSKIK